MVIVALAAGIGALNSVFEFEGLRVASDASYAAAFGTAGSNALVLLLLDLQHYGLLVAQIFFGLWLVPLGYLAYRSSGMFPRWLGVLLIIGGVSYLVDLLLKFLVPGIGGVASLVIVPFGNRGAFDGPLPARDRRPRGEAKPAGSGPGIGPKVFTDVVSRAPRVRTSKAAVRREERADAATRDGGAL